jgi:hypothetical protein
VTLNNASNNRTIDVLRSDSSAPIQVILQRLHSIGLVIPVAATRPHSSKFKRHLLGASGLRLTSTLIQGVYPTDPQWITLMVSIRNRFSPALARQRFACTKFTKNG